ncbi:hypothetical protein [Streptomyces roseicoloratus]|uniref:Uncharacterized protein n=1 Tax=Streptomyces roseicoloratus TaxID=2508722 RepID=A0ABY9S1T4_9ACTN|nr:hypothetical protein [Streptomyces roseicoloratus]WMX48384.1 hypothetical protein RGF97_31245 [Streptomyces roseicoloratus]
MNPDALAVHLVELGRETVSEDGAAADDLVFGRGRCGVGEGNGPAAMRE